MGHKVSPTCLRLGINSEWSSRWFAASKSLFVDYLREDRAIRDFLTGELNAAAVARIDIERSPERVRVVLHTARPGVLIGRRGEHIQRLQETVQRIIGTQKQLKMDYIEIQNPYVEAALIAQSIAFQLEKRVAYRRAMKRSIQQAMDSGALGIRLVCKGRLGGSEMKRRESYRNGKVPLGTLRAKIEYGEATSHTTAGCIGVKVWVYKGDTVIRKRLVSARAAAPELSPRSAGTESVAAAVAPPVS